MSELATTARYCRARHSPLWIPSVTRIMLPFRPVARSFANRVVFKRPANRGPAPASVEILADDGSVKAARNVFSPDEAERVRLALLAVHPGHKTRLVVNIASTPSSRSACLEFARA